MTPEHKQEIERVKEQAMLAFGHVEGVSMEDALATMVLMLQHHTDERNEALDLNTRRANQLAQAWRAADDAEKRAIELLQGLKG